MADVGRDRVANMVLGAWDAFLEQAEAVDLARRSRLPGWRAQEICVHLGLWPENEALADLIASARAGGNGTPPDVDAVNAQVTAAHREASRDEVLAALRRNRDATAAYLADEPVALDSAPTVSVVGRLPLLSVVLGQAYELAVHGLDLAACGAPPPPAAVLHSGLAALADVTGALAAACDITGGASLVTPDGGWAFAADGQGWTVREIAAGDTAGTAVEGSAELLLEAAPAVEGARARRPAQAGPDRVGGARNPGRPDPRPRRAHDRWRGRRRRTAVRARLTGGPRRASGSGRPADGARTAHGLRTGKP
jgi:uncharacterized protein (TIGR03083 family)